MNMKRSKIYQLIQNLKDLRTKTSKARLSKQNLDKDDKEIIKPSEPKIFLKKHKAKKENKSKKSSLYFFKSCWRSMSETTASQRLRISEDASNS